MEEYTIHNYELTNKKIINLEKIGDISFSNDVAYPKLIYGYNHFIMQNILHYKSKLEKLKLNKSTLDVPENFIITLLENYNNEEKKETFSIMEKMNNYLKKLYSGFPLIDNNYFFQLWELQSHFSIIHKTQKFTSIHITDTENTEFIKATLAIRLKLNSNALKNDDYIIISPMDTTNNDFYKKFNKNIKINVPEEADLITTEINSFDNMGVLTEQKALKIYITNLTNILHFQKNGGDLVFKIFETYTQPSLNIIEILKTLYTTVYFSKPLTSHKNNYEKYLVCKKFKKENATKTVLKNLENILDEIEKNNEFKIFNCFEKIKIEQNIIDEYIELNSIFEIIKFEGLCSIMNYISLENLSGFEYNNYVELREKANNFWIDKFL